LKAFDKFKKYESSSALNERPDKYDETQQFVLLLMENGGVDLEKYIETKVFLFYEKNG
jgi:hypothetical protein